MIQDQIKEIDQKEEIKQVTILGTPLWLLIRLKYFEILREKEGYLSRTITINWSLILKIIRNLFFGIANVKKLFNAEFIYFSSSDRRKYFNGYYYDRIIDIPLSLNNKSVCIENPFPLGFHYNSKLVYQHNKVIGQSIFFIFTFLFSNLFFFKKSISKYELLSQHLSYEFNYKSIVDRFVGQYYFMKFLLLFIKPKLVFFVYSASSYGFIKALKEKNIKVVELQHGVINDKHLAYNVYSDFGTSVFPSYLFTYGYYERKIFTDKNYFINYNNVIPIGYSMLDFYTQKRSQRVNKFLESIPSNFSIIIAVSHQEPFHNLLIDFISKASKFNSNILFLIFTRSLINDNHSFETHNVIFVNDLNIYEGFQFCDYHISINSTCVLEAFQFGLRSILLDINNLASQYYGNTFINFKSIRFVTDPSDLIRLLYCDDFTVSKIEIIEEGKIFFRPNFLNNFKDALITLNC